MNAISFTRLQLSLVLISISIIAYQIVLIQILSFVQWYHFAYMIISIAMLGFGTAGTVLSLFRDKLLNSAEKIVPLLMILSGLTMPAVIYISQFSFIRFDTMLFFTGNYQMVRLLTNYMLFTIPFFLGALAIGIIFVKHVESIGKLYFSNLIGSGIGGLIVLILIWIFFPEKLFAIIGFFAVTSGLILINKNKFNLEFYLILCVSLLILVYFYVLSPQLQSSEFKSRSRTLLLQNAKILERKTSPYGILEIISSPMIRSAEGLSLKFQDEIKSGYAVFCNGDWIGPLISEKQNNLSNLFNHTTSQLPFALRNRNKVLVLNSGSGIEILRSLNADAKRVIAVEPNISLIEILTSKYSELNDSAYLNRVVSVNKTTARSFLLSNNEKFDLIIIPSVDAFGGTSGLFSLQEQYHLTREAIGDMLSQLNPDGVVMFNVWLDYPPRNSLKILSTIAEALENKNLDNRLNYVAAIKNWNYLTIIVKATPITTREEENIKAFCKKMLFDPVLLPNIQKEDRDRFNRLADNQLYLFIDKIFLSKNERELLYDEYAFCISPATDDKPFFSQFLRWKNIESVIKDFGSQNVPFLELGYIILYITLIQIFIVAIVFIILPLLKIGFQGKNKFRVLIYFSGIGFGYMFVEIILIQMFTLYFDNSIYSASAVICLMLVCSGFGSYMTQNSEYISSKLKLIITVVVALLLIQALILKEILYSTIQYSLFLKVLLALVLIAPGAFLMGMLFPVGIRKTSNQSPVLIPWAWGINGFASVLATVLATIISVEFGFTAVFICAALFYLVVVFSANKTF